MDPAFKEMMRSPLIPEEEIPHSQPTFKEIVTSQTTVFTVGEDRKPIVMHRDVIRAYGLEFHQLFERETSWGSVMHFPSVEVEDFIRFCEFYYRGDYTVPALKGPVSPTARDSLSPPPRQRQRRTKGSPDIASAREAQLTPNPDQDFMPSFLALVRLHVFAKVQKAWFLMYLASVKLDAVLHIFPLGKERVGDIIQLAKYLYSNELSEQLGQDEDGKLDLMREDVMVYIVKIEDTISQHPDWSTLSPDGQHEGESSAYSEFRNDYTKVKKEHRAE